MLITLASDYLYVLAMLKTTPLLVTVGLSLTIPLAIAADWLFLGKSAALQVMAGGTLVLVSFIILGVADVKAEEEHERDLSETIYE
jgi:solute carrier family 35 protein F5